MADKYWKVEKLSTGAFCVTDGEGHFISTSGENYIIKNNSEFAGQWTCRINADAAAHYANYLNFRPEPPVVKLPGITGIEWSLQRDTVSMSPWVNIETVKHRKRDVIAWHRASLAALEAEAEIAGPWKVGSADGFEFAAVNGDLRIVFSGEFNKPVEGMAPKEFWHRIGKAIAREANAIEAERARAHE
jgi:hypothetical protein